MTDAKNQLTVYQEFTRNTAVYPKDQELTYLMLGLISEVGEIADKLKKHIRDSPEADMTDEQINAISKEMGDVLWYLARLADHFELSLEDVMLGNIAKLTKRLASDKIRGSGDDR